MKDNLHVASAVQAAAAIREGTLTSEALVEACLTQIERTEPQIKAWAHLDAEAVRGQAREADRIRRAGRATGALHGVPVGLKDIIDTRTMPTERGSAVFEGRQTGTDARIVERLIDDGAILMGKTQTTECAYLNPSMTANPHDTTRTPGGSSSGSASAVGARHVPLSIGSQTGGSVIRPASFCGTYGFKPTRGLVSRTGLLRTSVTLDNLGVFGNTLEDVALLADVIAGYDQTDPASVARPQPSMLAGAQSEAPVEPDIAWFDMPYHDRLEDDAREGMEAVIESLGARVERFPTAPQLAGLTDVHKTIYDYELVQNLGELVDTNEDKVSDLLKASIANARTVTQTQYEDAMAVKTSAEDFFVEHFNDFDAILSPSATGEAPPLANGTTGDAIFCTIWTLAGLPCLTIPALVGANGLPVGVQLIGAAEEDDRLMRTASWLQNALAEAGQQEED